MPKTSMKKEYGTVPKGANINRSSFDIGETHKTTFDVSEICPFYWTYAYPGEVFNGGVDCFLRMSSPLDFPIMDNMKISVHWYSAPLRILWDNFRKFFGERTSPADSIAYTMPTLTGTQNMALKTAFTELGTKLNLPMKTIDLTNVGAMPFRAYNAIYNWHYRDQNLINSLAENTGDGPDVVGDYGIKQRGKRWDYFTNNLPQPQKGDAVTIGGEVAVAGSAGNFTTVYSDVLSDFQQLDTGGATLDLSASSGNEAYKLYPNTTINELRNAVAIQRFLEADNRYGTRFDEIIYAHYGAEFNDVRIAPVFLGGGSGYISTSAIPNQTVNDDVAGNLGDLAAIATGGLSGARFTYAVDEPSIIMGLIMVQSDLTYQQGVQRKHRYQTRYDLFSPEFVGIGDQATLRGEIYWSNSAATDDAVFGYNPRFEEMRTGVNWVSGEFNSDYASSLDSWHLSEDFASAPALNETFITETTTPVDRIMQVSTVDHFLADIRINMRAARALPVSGVPGLARL